MRLWLIVASFLTLAIAGGEAEADTLRIEVRDDRGDALADAVVYLVPQDRAQMPRVGAASRPARLIDQSNETFIPLVTAVRRGDRVVFRNSDKTRHHAYSFSRVGKFENLLEPGALSAPITFDQTGVLAIGCNIHDFMVAYIFVAGNDWFAVSDAEGRAEIADVPPGAYAGMVWHPDMKSRHQLPTIPVVIGRVPQDLALTVDVRRPRDQSRRHGSEY